MIEKISQSFIKDIRSYFAGELCGNIVRERWINDRLLDNGEPGQMELGSYFEFLLSGAIPKNGKPPVPQYMPSKIKVNGGSVVGLSISDMLVGYRQAHTSSALVKDYIHKMGLKIVSVGKTLTKGRFIGTIDLICEVIEVKEGFTWSIGQRIVIDLKYSGLVGKNGDRYNKHGWQWSKIQKEYHGTQARQYHFVSGLEFYFLVTQSNQKEGDEPIIKMFYIPIDEFMIEQHIAEANDLFQKFEFASRTVGFEARPSFNVCADCVLFNECVDKHTYPHPEVIDLTIE